VGYDPLSAVYYCAISVDVVVVLKTAFDYVIMFHQQHQNDFGSFVEERQGGTDISSELKLPRHNLGRVFNSRRSCEPIPRTNKRNGQTAQLKVENSAQTTLELSPSNFFNPWKECFA
jgi:hypothetical protein